MHIGGQSNEIASHDAHAARRPFKIQVNDQEFQFSDPIPTGRQILSSAGFTPPDESVLIHLTRPGSKSIGLDEEIDLRDPGKEEFRAFHSDRIFTFTVDGRGYEWGRTVISEPELRDIAGVPEDRVLVLERQDEPDTLLGPHDKVDVGKRGTERLRTVPHLITVFYNGDDHPVQMAPGVYTTEQLMKLFGVESGYLLNVVDDGEPSRTLKPGETIKVKDGMHFFSQVPCGGAS